MLPFAYAALTFVATAINLFSSLSIFPVVFPLGFRPVGREFIAASARWIRKQSRAFHNYGRRRHKPSSSFSQPLVTPTFHRASRTQPWPPPPTPTLVQQILAVPAVQVIDAALQCQLPPLALQPLACSLWDQPPAYTGPTSLNLYTPLALALYSPVVFPLLSALPALVPAASLIALNSGSLQPVDGEFEFEFSWICALLPLPFVLFALHKLFPSKAHRASRNRGLKKAKKRKSKAKRRVAQVVPESPVVVPPCPHPTQPVLESEIDALAPSSTNVGLESAETTVDDVPCVPEVTAAESTTESSTAALPNDEELESEGWTKVQRKHKEDKGTSPEHKQPNGTKSAKPVPSIPQPPTAKPTQARRGDHVQPRSVHYDPPELKNKDLTVQQQNEALNETSVVQQVGPWSIPRRADGSATRVYRLPRAYPALSEVTPSNVTANRLRMLGPKRDRYAPNATVVGSLSAGTGERPKLTLVFASTRPHAHTPGSTGGKGKGKAHPPKRKQGDSQPRCGTIQDLILTAIENPATTSPQERKRKARPERRRSHSKAKATRTATLTTWSA